MFVYWGAAVANAPAAPGGRRADPRHGDDDAKSGKQHDMAGMTKAEMAAMERKKAADDKGLALLENGEMAHMYGPDEPLDKATRAVLVHQLALTKAAAEKYPTLGAARAGGYKPSGAYEPGLGMHMNGGSGSFGGMNPDGTISDAMIANPPTIIYDGHTNDAPVAGFMYTTMSEKEPEGFAGPNDHWHFHTKLCVKQTPDGIKVVHVGAVTSKKECAAQKAIWVPQNAYMVHVWTVPGYASNRGVFSDVNPSIACSDGTYFRVSDKQMISKYRINHCRADAA
jgi:hypothetical protein